MKKVEGIIPVMITPFDEANKIDYAGVERLIEWYLANGSDALFAVCQSSEMIYLSLEERHQLGKFVVDKVRGRVPVVASGHISDDPFSQVEELTAAARTGADGIVLVTNHLDPKNHGEKTFLGNLKWLLERLPKDIPFGLYECPAPYRRLLSDNEIQACIDTGRFIFLKDVSCDLAVLKRRIAIAEGTPFTILNANAAIAYDAMKAGARGFNGIALNYHPDLYQWLYTSGPKHPQVSAEVAHFLVLAALSEAFGYPVLAKILHQRLGTFSSIKSRAVTFDVRERFWALDAIIDSIQKGSDIMRAKIAGLA